MSLTARLSALFLAGLAIVLAGFSICVYVLADDYLERRERDRLESALEILRAAAEVDHDGIEWEGRQRMGILPSDVVWAIHADGLLVDSTVSETDMLRTSPAPSAPARSSADAGSDRRGLRWTLHVDSRIAPKKHAHMVLTAAISTKARREMLRNLAVVLLGVSSAIWLAALFAGRWYCRRALRPVAVMAVQAQNMQVDDGRDRLIIAPSGDELETLGTSFNGLLDRLHEALERQRRFTGDASHQLRTPLAGLLGQVELALRRERDSDEYRRTLEHVYEQAGQLNRIVEMLLFLARADAEACIDRLTPIELTAWLGEQMKRWEVHPRRRDLRISAAGSIQVNAHGPLLGQLLDNLIDNALKYSEPGTPVTIRLERAGDSVQLLVEDEGQGIAAEDLPRLFEPFYRSKHARDVDRNGTGLGLSVARRIAELLGGTLKAESRGAKGSRFVLTLQSSS